MATEPRRVGGTVKKTTNTNTGQVTNYRNGQPIQQHSSGAQIFHQSPDRVSGRLSPEQMAAFNAGNQDINQFLGSQGLLPQNNSVPNYASQIPQAQPQQQQIAPINFDQFRTEAVTAEDLAKQWGFDYSRDYADRQAAVEAEAARNAYNDLIRRNQSANRVNQQQIDSSVAGAAQALDDNYFQQMLQQQQAQVGAGLTGGIAADQDLRLQMNRQNALGDVYRDANVGRMAEQERFTNAELQLLEQLGLIDQQELAYADQLHNQRLNEGFQNALALMGLNQNENLAMLQAALQERGQNIDMSQFADQLGLARDQFDWQKQTDTADRTGLLGDQQTLAALQQQFMQDYMNRDMEFNQQQQEWLNRFNYGQAIGQFGNGQRTQQAIMNEWARMMDAAGLTGQFRGQQTQQAQAQEFAQMMQMLQHHTQNQQFYDQLNQNWAGQMLPYQQMTANQQAQMAQWAQELAQQQRNQQFREAMEIFDRTGQLPEGMASQLGIDLGVLQSVDGSMDLLLDSFDRIERGARPADVLDRLELMRAGGLISEDEYTAVERSLMNMYPQLGRGGSGVISSDGVTTPDGRQVPWSEIWDTSKNIIRDGLGGSGTPKFDTSSLNPFNETWDWLQNILGLGK